MTELTCRDPPAQDLNQKWCIFFNHQKETYPRTGMTKVYEKPPPKHSLSWTEMNAGTRGPDRLETKSQLLIWQQPQRLYNLKQMPQNFNTDVLQSSFRLCQELSLTLHKLSHKFLLRDLAHDWLQEGVQQSLLQRPKNRAWESPQTFWRTESRSAVEASDVPWAQIDSIAHEKFWSCSNWMGTPKCPMVFGDNCTDYLTGYLCDWHSEKHQRSHKGNAVDHQLQLSFEQNSEYLYKNTSGGNGIENRYSYFILLTENMETPLFLLLSKKYKLCWI